MGTFRFKQFSLENTASAMKVGTDAVLLGSIATLRGDEQRILDIGTGTGVISMMLAQRLSSMAPEFAIHGIDIDAPSAAEAASNFAACPWSAQLSAQNCALSQYCPDGPFDLIVSNPPYFDSSLLNPDERESMARHTQTLSYREICAFAAENLRAGGRLALVLPSDVATSLRRSAVSFGLAPSRLVSIRTSSRKPVKRIIAEFTKGEAQLLEEELTMQEGAEFTAQYRVYVSPFLLSL